MSTASGMAAQPNRRSAAVRMVAPMAPAIV